MGATKAPIIHRVGLRYNCLVTSPPQLLPPLPRGWYAVAFASDVRPGQLIRRTFAGQQIVLWRGQSGQVRMMDAYCPHMGAHLGYGGAVLGDCVVCPFHGFRFAADGRCVATGYGAEPPALRIPTLPVRETNGLLMAFHDPEGKGPTWYVPDLDTDGWTRIHGHCITDIDSHLEDIAESTIDLRRFSATARYRDVRSLSDPRLDGPYFYTRYGMTRTGVLTGLGDFRSECDVHIHGLGFALVEAEIQGAGLRARVFILPAPTASQKIDLRLGASVRAPERRLLRAMPRAGWARLVLRGLVSDVMADYELWHNKAHLPAPGLARGDGPLGVFRRWARRFYPDAQPVDVPGAGSSA